MRRFHNTITSTSTPWLDTPFKKNQLERLTVDQILLVAKTKKGIKKKLIEFLLEEK